jgi:hypothetical protein
VGYIRKFVSGFVYYITIVVAGFVGFGEKFDAERLETGKGNL